MNTNELRSVEKPLTAVAADDVPPALLERATAYNEAIDAFRDVVRGTLAHLQGGRALDAEWADLLRIAAVDLVAAREWLLAVARLPSDARRRRA